MQHTIAKWANADVIVYVGCGERGNEIAQILEEFPKLEDPFSKRPLMERTIIIANTSNMPVTAREASIYTGITISEYYRDQGYDVTILADSTSRWAEALREISSRMEEIPAEEGYPAYLASRLAEFYERAGNFTTLNGERGSITAIGAVSPQGGDFSEPVTQNTKRFIRCFWALDRDLAYSKHYPAISWRKSYSEYEDELVDWWKRESGIDWAHFRTTISQILKECDRLENIIKIVGFESLPDSEKLTVFTGEIIKKGFLQQNANDEKDSFCCLEKQVEIISLIMKFYDLATTLIKEDISFYKIKGSNIAADLKRLKFIEGKSNDFRKKTATIESVLEELRKNEIR